MTASLVLTKNSSTDRLRLHFWRKLKLPNGLDIKLDLVAWPEVQIFGPVVFFLTILPLSSPSPLPIKSLTERDVIKKLKA